MVSFSVKVINLKYREIVFDVLHVCNGPYISRNIDKNSSVFIEEKPKDISWEWRRRQNFEFLRHALFVTYESLTSHLKPVLLETLKIRPEIHFMKNNGTNWVFLAIFETAFIISLVFFLCRD